MTRSQNGSAWTVEITRQAEKELRKLGAVSQSRVRNYLQTFVEGSDNPRGVGKPLGGMLSDYWAYRVGDIRILCRIEDHKLVVVVVTVGNRREIYR